MFRKNLVTLFLILTAALLLTAGCAAGNSPQQKKDIPINPKPTQEKVSFTLFFGDDQAMYLLPEQREVEKGTSKLPELMIQELLKGPKGDAKSATIPPEAKLLSLDIVDEIAFVNFSKEIKTKHWGGSAGETMTIYSIVNTLTQLPDIKKVQFLIEGEKQEAIWGNTITNLPIEPNGALIKQSN